MRATVLAVLLAFSAPSIADTWVTASVTSWHEEHKHYNQFNPGLGFETGSETLRAVGGFYRNSLYRTTWYAGAAYVPWQLGPFRAGGMVALASGYSSHLVPIPVPVLTYEGKRYGANLLVMPPIDEEHKKGVLGFQVKAKF